MASTHLSRSVLDALDQAQAELYEHLLGDTGGRCTLCGEPEPCRRRNAVTTTILGYGRLPQR